MKKRQGEVATAAESIVVYNNWQKTGDDNLLKEIEKYNEIDCISTKLLRDWLLNLRPEYFSKIGTQTSLVAPG